MASRRRTSVLVRMVSTWARSLSQVDIRVEKNRALEHLDLALLRPRSLRMVCSFSDFKLLQREGLHRAPPSTSASSLSRMDFRVGKDHSLEPVVLAPMRPLTVHMVSSFSILVFRIDTDCILESLDLQFLARRPFSVCRSWA